ncbi:MAG: NUDIX hydrolase [Nanoarchaeota archaeon]|nr:NUDIX hydrolase [Nanoarchaeota archaeon]
MSCYIDLLERHKEQKDYRPTVVAGIYDSQGRIVLVRSPKSDLWNLPQGGLDDDDPLDAFYRELGEELGISRSDLDNVSDIIDYGKLDLPWNRDGFSQGKSYFLVSALFNGSLKPNALEISAVLRAEEKVAGDFLSEDPFSHSRIIKERFLEKITAQIKGSR